MRDDPQYPEPSCAGKERTTTVLDVRGILRATQQNTVAAVLGRRPGVLEVEVNPVAQSATVVFDPRRTSLAELRGWVTRVRLPLRRPVDAGPYLRSDGRAGSAWSRDDSRSRAPRTPAGGSAVARWGEGT